MKKASIKKLVTLVSILENEWAKPKCRSYCWSCPSCDSQQLIKEFKSFIDVYLISDEEQKKFAKKLSQLKK